MSTDADVLLSRAGVALCAWVTAGVLCAQEPQAPGALGNGELRFEVVSAAVINARKSSCCKRSQDTGSLR